jgi:NADH-quinone oxidoreductase subunit M
MAGLVIHNIEERDLTKLGGLARQVPVMAAVFSIAGLASLGLPTTSGFAAEFLSSWAAITAAWCPILPFIRLSPSSASC